MPESGEIGEMVTRYYMIRPLTITITALTINFQGRVAAARAAVARAAASPGGGSLLSLWEHGALDVSHAISNA